MNVYMNAKLKLVVDAAAVLAVIVLAAAGVWLSLKKETAPERVKKIEQMKKGRFHFEFDDLSGNALSLESYKGRVVLVNIWAVWCAPCIEEIPSLLQLAQKFSEELVIVAVSEEPPGAVKNFFSRFPKPPPNFVLSFSSHIREVFFPQALPESYLLDKQGRLSLKILGPRNWYSLEWINKIKELSRK